MGTKAFVSKYIQKEIFYTNSSNLLKTFKEFEQSSKLYDD